MIKKDKSYKPSINSIVIPLIIFSVFITISINALISYYTFKNQYLFDMKQSVDQTAIVLSKSISSFIASYNINEYEKLIKNELKDNDMIAIIVQDYNTAKIMGEENFITGSIKIDEETIEFDEENQEHKEMILDPFYKKEIDILNKDNTPLGKLSLYKSDNELNNKIEDLIVDNTLYGFFTALLIICSILFVLKLFLSNPIELIIKNIKKDELKDQELNSISKKIYLKEIDILFDAIVQMYKTIKSSNEKLSQTKAELIQAQKVAKTGHFVYDIKNDVLEFSQVLNDLFELDKNIKKDFNTWIDMIDPKERDSILEYYDFISSSSLNFDKKYKIISPSGKEKWVHSIAIFEKDEQNIPIKLFGTIQDITQNIEYETKLHQALTVFNNTHDGIIITDKDAIILNVNRSFEDITGFTAVEAIGKNPNILKSDIQKPSFYAKMWDEIKNKGSWTGEITNKDKQGKYFQELLTINKILDNNGDIINYIGVFSDISIQKEQEKILLQQSRTSAVGEMIGNIAHQWRQPLSVISTVASGISLHLELNKELDNATMKERLSTITEQTKYLSKTIDDFRNFFKGNQSELNEVQLEKTIYKAINLTRDSFINNFIDFDINIDENIKLNINENLFIQGIINLLNNAKDALIENLKEDRYFKIEASIQYDEIIIKIVDNAGGIKKQNIDRIFDPYFTTKHESVGTGLGLHMTHQIINKHLKGNIYFDNVKIIHKDKEYKGAQFTIVLPK